jgi:hypothetical protein
MSALVPSAIGDGRKRCVGSRGRGAGEIMRRKKKYGITRAQGEEGEGGPRPMNLLVHDAHPKGL